MPPIRSNYHTHSRYCDAKGEIEAYLEAALAAGLDSYGVSSHAPLPFDTGWTMRLADLPAYCAEVRRLQAAYRDRLPVFLGLELDYYPGLEAFHRDAVLAQGLDYVVGSVHYVGHAGPGEPWCVDESDEVMREGIARSFGGDARRMVEEYYALQRAMVRAEPIAFVGHLDRVKIWNADGRYFREDAPWYRAAVEETLRAIRAADLPIELNTRGWLRAAGAPYPSDWVLERAHALGLPVVVNTDAHRPEEVASFYPEAAELLRRVGYREILRFNGTAWRPTPL